MEFTTPVPIQERNGSSSYPGIVRRVYVTPLAPMSYVLLVVESFRSLSDQSMTNSCSQKEKYLFSDIVPVPCSSSDLTGASRESMTRPTGTDFE